METGFRRTQLGAVIPRDIITDFVCTYNGAEIFRAEFHPAIAANPFIAFSTRRHRKRHHRLQMDRRQRLLAHRVRRDHGRLNISHHARSS